MIVIYHVHMRINKMPQLQEKLKPINLSPIDDLKTIYSISKEIYAEIANEINLKCVFNFVCMQFFPQHLTSSGKL